MNLNPEEIQMREKDQPSSTWSVKVKIVKEREWGKSLTIHIYWKNVATICAHIVVINKSSTVRELEEMMWLMV